MGRLDLAMLFTKRASWALVAGLLVASLLAGTEAVRDAPFRMEFEDEDFHLSGGAADTDLTKYLKTDPNGKTTALDAYMANGDQTYSWNYNGTKMTGVMPTISGWTAYQVILTSQTWLTPQEAGSCSHWEHDLLIFIPDNLDDTLEQATLFITEGLDPPTTKNDKEQNILLGSAMAAGTKAVTAVLFQVPNQYCTFPGDPKQKKREEDAVIAFTWRTFIDLKRKNDTRADQWPVRLPMVKAAVRAMDATQDFVSKCEKCVKRPRKIDNFITMGASKRGWTTWLTGAVDKRVVAMAPIVMDAANQHQLFHRWYQNFGGWSFAVHDYTDEDLMAELDSPEFTDLLTIIDPFSYKDRLTMPKLVISATGDEFFQVMDDHYWFKEMPGNNLLLRAANADHSEMTGIPVLLPSTMSFFLNIAKQQKQAKALAEGRSVKLRDAPQHPVLTWEFAHVNEGTDQESATMNVTVDVANGPKPEKVWFRYAHTDPNSGRLDFRWFNLDENCALPKVDGKVCPTMMVWFSEEMTPVQQTGSQWVYTVSLKAPAKGWGGFFVELRFPGISELFFELPYTVTTQTVVTPTKLPFPDCHGAECEGKLV